MIIIIINIIYFTLVLALFIFGQYGDWMGKYDTYYDAHSSYFYAVYLLFDAVIKLISALLIVYSLLKFKRLLLGMRQSNAGFFANERLMIVHLSIFATFILSNFGICIETAIYLVKYKNWH